MGSIEHTDWLLTTQERDNAQTRVDDVHPHGQAWSEGNLVRPLIHGATYFAELFRCVEATTAGDLLLFTDWAGDADEQLLGTPGSEVVDVLARADERGVDVRGLIWRSHMEGLNFSAKTNRTLGQQLQDRGAEALLDMRVRTGGSHHQKMVVIRYKNDPASDIAFIGGIDLCHSRRDTIEHHGDPQPFAMAPEYGDTPPWHDIQAAIQGPAVYDAETVFRERWEDPTPLTRHPVYWTQDRLLQLDMTPDPLPEQWPAPPSPEGGTQTVQLLRTYPNLRHGRDYPFARGGERSVARGYTKALRRARQAGLHRGPVPLGRAGRHGVHRGAEGQRRAACGRGGAAATPTRTGSRPVSPSSSVAPARSGRCRRLPRGGSRCTAWRTGPAPRSTCTPRPA